MLRNPFEYKINKSFGMNNNYPKHFVKITNFLKVKNKILLNFIRENI